MNKYSILVADSGSGSRNQICNLLTKKGYKTYEATDGASTLRIARGVRPSLVLIDVGIWGMNAYELARIIEKDNLSTVIFITSNPNQAFQQNIAKMKIFVYITKPLNFSYFYQIIEFSLNNIKRLSMLEEKVKKLESTLASRKKIDKAKGILMKDMNISEEEAYEFIRKKSMDECTTMEKVAEKIINSRTQGK